ncbi:hypothetical protein L6452_31351 [Arctium lappa]|uniref:Uncharacterized protein n=1 Tax=Arctium lappa TaxID=4217 RepID=A0ACB8ZLW2_ARCLA|nr:hypothetical protein L6452_31351 [Arctium lappa]
MVKVQWKHHRGTNVTWEAEEDMRRRYPHFISLSLSELSIAGRKTSKFGKVGTARDCARESDMVTIAKGTIAEGLRATGSVNHHSASEATSSSQPIFFLLELWILGLNFNPISHDPALFRRGTTSFPRRGTLGFGCGISPSCSSTTILDEEIDVGTPRVSGSPSLTQEVRFPVGFVGNEWMALRPRAVFLGDV